MCPPVSPCKGASAVKFPAYNACIFGMEMPLRGRSGGHIGTAPTVSFGQIACGWFCLGGLCANGYFICVGLRDAFLPPMCCVGRGLLLQQYWLYCLSLVKLKCRVGIISSVARRALHICKWLRSILRAWGWNGFRAGRRPPSLCAPRISRLLFGSR